LSVPDYRRHQFLLIHRLPSSSYDRG
jgi:hypothetical protein